ncbi:unnamed protein product, partial [Mesorhabditis spiculigera]
MESTILKFSVIAFGIEILLMLGGFISLCCYYRFNEKLNAMFYNRLKQVEKECKWKLDAYDKLIQKEKPGVSVKGPGTTATAPKTPAPQTVPAPSVGGEMNMDDEIDKLLDPRMFIQEMPQSREPLPPESKKGGKARQRAPSLQAQATMNNSHKETVVTPLRLSKEKAGDEVTQFTVEMTCEDGSDRAAV